MNPAMLDVIQSQWEATLPELPTLQHEHNAACKENPAVIVDWKYYFFLIYLSEPSHLHIKGEVMMLSTVRAVGKVRKMCYLPSELGLHMTASVGGLSESGWG